MVGLDVWESGSAVGVLCPIWYKIQFGGLRCHVRILFIIKHNIKQLKSQPARQRNNIISVPTSKKKLHISSTWSGKCNNSCTV